MSPSIAGIGQLKRREASGDGIPQEHRIRRCPDRSELISEDDSSTWKYKNIKGGKVNTALHNDLRMKTKEDKAGVLRSPGDIF